MGKTRSPAAGNGGGRRYLVLCPDYDEAGFWVHDQLAAAGRIDGELVRSSELDLATRWRHRLGNDDPDVEVQLGDGRILSGDAFSGVLNRLTAVPACLAPFAVEQDREYATSEATAFAMSWLACLPNVLNPPTSQGMGGAWRHMSEWAILAAAAGLAVPVYRQDEDNWIETGQRALMRDGSSQVSVVLFRDQVYGPVLPKDIGDACVRLGASAQADILGIDLACTTGSDQLTFSYASPWPDLRVGGTAFVNDLADALAGRPP